MEAMKKLEAKNVIHKLCCCLAFVVPERLVTRTEKEGAKSGRLQISVHRLVEDGVELTVSRDARMFQRKSLYVYWSLAEKQWIKTPEFVMSG